jgi:hypothetical protein
MEQGPAQPQTRKIEQLKQNLAGWSSVYWLTFFVVIPLLLLLVYALPQPVKADYFIFHTANLTRLQTYLLSSYTHSEFYPHLVANLALYLIAIAAIFAFETRRRRFHLMAGISLLVVPVICSLLTAGFWDFFSADTSMQGFSGIDAAFLAYALLAGVTWSLDGRLELFDHPEQFAGSRTRFYLINGLLTLMLVFIVFEGILFGQFTSTGTAISNGIAHFGGFITGLIVFLIYDLVTEQRRAFDFTLGISILAGLLIYAYYLVMVVKAVKGL